MKFKHIELMAAVALAMGAFDPNQVRGKRKDAGLDSRYPRDDEARKAAAEAKRERKRSKRRAS